MWLPCRIQWPIPSHQLRACGLHPVLPRPTSAELPNAMGAPFHRKAMEQPGTVLPRPMSTELPNAMVPWQGWHCAD
eukprot:Skav227577  [mRNA]  locus=scaffold517:77978:87107:- [translate_table: standard]